MLVYTHICICCGCICIDIHILFLNQILLVVVEVLLIDSCVNFEVCNDYVIVARIA